MAVYKKSYRPYEGALTPTWSRLFVLTRYSFEELRKSRFLTIFFLVSMIDPLISALLIYTRHNASVLKLINLEAGSKLIDINVTFFLSLLGWQSMLALFLAAFVGPGLVSPDLANNGLALYMARPFSRVEYVLGKMNVLVILMSVMTWIPGLLCFLLQSYLEDWSWAAQHARLAMAIFVGSWVWILLLALMALALSAWVKWRPAAGGLMFVLFFVTAGFGAMINNIQRVHWGNLFNMGYLVGSIWVNLFEGAAKTTNGAIFFRVPMGEEMPLWSCWLALAAICGVFLYMLARKIRGAEVVR